MVKPNHSAIATTEIQNIHTCRELLQWSNPTVFFIYLIVRKNSLKIIKFSDQAGKKHLDTIQKISVRHLTLRHHFISKVAPIKGDLWHLPTVFLYPTPLYCANIEC